MGKKLIILLSFVLILNSCNNFSEKEKQIKDFVPENWEIISQGSGDLNKDNLEDVAFVIKLTNKKYIIADEGLGKGFIDYNPRLLIVLFKDAINNRYNLIAENDCFIPKDVDPVLEDPFRSISIEKGNLLITCGYWASAGSWYSDVITYKFRYQENDFALIGAEEETYHRASGESFKRSINFLTKKLSETKYEDSDDVKPKIVWKKFKLKELHTLTTFKAFGDMGIQ